MRATGWIPILLLLVLRVPFDFQVGRAFFGPGEYTLQVEGSAATIRVRKAGDTHRTTTPTVSFRVYGDRRFLSAIALQDGARWEILPSADEAGLARTHGAPKLTELRVDALDKK